MNLPLQIAFRNMPPSEAVERAIEKHMESLGRFSGRIMGCRVVVEARHHRHHQGNLFHIRIGMTVPGREIVVSREPALHQAHEDVYVAFRDAFEAVGRRLQDYERRHRRQVKAHDVPPRGRIAFLDYASGYGFIETPDGREIYFHRNSVLDADFDRLDVGELVRFHEEGGEKGPQASTVRVAEKLVEAV